MKRLIYIVLLLISYVCVYFVGSHTFELGTVYNTQDALIAERQLCNATTEMLHDYWEFLDIERDENDSIISRHNFWLDCIMETEGYYIADSIRNHDWEDFFYDWYAECD